jgi:hypothetical protein
VAGADDDDVVSLFLAHGFLLRLAARFARARGPGVQRRTLSMRIVSATGELEDRDPGLGRSLAEPLQGPSGVLRRFNTSLRTRSSPRRRPLSLAGRRELEPWTPGSRDTGGDENPFKCEYLGRHLPEAFAAEPIPRAEERFQLEDDRTILAETRHHADQVAIVRGRWKLIHDRQRRQFMLFDLERDPTERVNLFARRPRVSRPLQDILRDYDARPGRKPEAEPMGEELREVLETLGYVEQGEPNDSRRTRPLGRGHQEEPRIRR